MANGRAWEEGETAELQRLAGRVPVAEIAKRMGRCERTIQGQILARDLPTYRPQRRTWTRKQWLMFDAAGLCRADFA